MAPEQADLPLRERFSWGGARKDAGRKKGGNVSHATREPLASRYPVHVTMRIRPEVQNLRRKWLHATLWRVFSAGKERLGLRITDWSVQGNHIHLIAEARDAQSLARGIQGLSIRLARNLNRRMKRKGRLFADRYHAHILRTAREVANAVAYVLNNARHHGTRFIERSVDAYSSAFFFDGWASAPNVGTIVPRDGPAPIAEPQTWLRRVGWRRYGLLRIV